MRPRTLFLLLAWLAVTFALPGQETFDVLKAGGQVYSNVTITTKAANDLYITHSKGFANVKVRDLEPAMQRELGYQLEEPKSRVHALPALELDPRIKEWQDKLTQGAEENIRQLDPQWMWFATGVSIVIYLFFCYCCMLICQKTGNNPGIFVWVPIFQIFPLLKAAGMSKWWFLALLVPGLNLIPGLIWPFRIARVRQKSALVGFLLLIPGFSILAFLYLAFSNGSEEEFHPTAPRLVEIH